MAKKSEMNFEARLKRLQAVVEALEAGDLPLEKGMALFKEGLGLVKSCREDLAKARHEVSIFSQGLVQPFDPVAQGESDATTSGEEEK